MLKKLLLFIMTLAILNTYTANAANTQQEQQEINKKTILAFYDAAINQKDFDAASQYLSPQLIQHNPMLEDGPEGVRKFTEYLKKNFPNTHGEIKKIFADGDYVILHVHFVKEPNTRGNAIVDIFRLENGKIAEHWDVIQEIPETSANSNGMF